MGAESCSDICKRAGFTSTKHTAKLAGVAPRTLELALRSPTTRFEDYLHVALLARQLAEKEALKILVGQQPARHKKEREALNGIIYDDKDS